MLSRRTFIVGGLGAAVFGGVGGLLGIEHDALPGRVRLAHLLGDCDVDGVPAPGPVGEVRSGEFASSARRRDVGWSLALPPGRSTVQGLPVALVLHGRGGDHTSGFTHLRLHEFLAAHVRGGGAPFALASVDGGASVYWHKRADGDDPIRMVTSEFLPLLRGLGLRTERIGVLGWSMGGYGALLLARESHRGMLDGVTVVAAAAGSPALFGSYGSSAAGAFDDAADFDRFGRLVAEPDIGATPVHVACGSSDAFTEQTRLFRDHISPTPAGGIRRGCHTDGYWRSLAVEQLAFLGVHLK
jgi:pimeloyl-ACP methyl ester carboxylesterase